MVNVHMINQTLSKSSRDGGSGGHGGRTYAPLDFVRIHYYLPPQIFIPCAIPALHTYARDIKENIFCSVYTIFENLRKTNYESIYPFMCTYCVLVTNAIINEIYQKILVFRSKKLCALFVIVS